MSEVRQRWRVVFARGEEARYLSHLDAVTQWERAFRRGSIPVATTGGFNARPKLVFAAPLQLGMLAEHELADLFLDERLTAPSLRARLDSGMPSGYRLVDLHDVWVGAPAIAPQLVAADYRMTLLGVERGELDAATARLLATERLQRERRREAKTIGYDLRPLIVHVRACDPDPAAVAPEGGSSAVTRPSSGEAATATAAVAGIRAATTTAAAAAAGIGLWMRLRHSQDRGSGRADEVVAALADELGVAAAVGAADEEGSAAQHDRAETSGRPKLEAVLTVRERLWLADELSL
jgi:radical SAM-linked protein